MPEKQNSSSGGKNRKIGKHLSKCKRYLANGTREENKELKKIRREKKLGKAKIRRLNRIAKFGLPIKKKKIKHIKINKKIDVEVVNENKDESNSN